MRTIFIDGSAGTTGLRIRERLLARKDISLITLSDAERKDPVKRKEALNDCDAAFLCLPDAAAIEAVSMIENPRVIVLDTSTAHRTHPDWAYGFPELSGAYRARICAANRIAVPGCHASGFIALVAPLVEAGLIRRDARLSCVSITGYSGGGKKMIAEYEDVNRAEAYQAPRTYALGQAHKHLPEMLKITGLQYPPVFEPIVCDYYSGMLTSVALTGVRPEDAIDVYTARYAGPIVAYTQQMDENGFVAANAMAENDGMRINVSGNDERLVARALFDNLGKGASGAAVQCLNLRLGLDELTGLDL